MNVNECDCGGIPEIIHDSLAGLYSISCDQCNSSTPGLSNFTDAQRMWNNWCRIQNYCFPDDKTFP